MRGKIIEFEGLDVSFKETNAKALADYLRKKGYMVSVISFPRYDAKASYFVQKLLDGSYGYVKPEVIHKMYALDRFDYIKMNNVESRLESGEWFIFDRYVGSSMLYQTADIKDNKKRIEMQNEIANYEYEVLGIPKPDLVIAMYSTLDLIVQKISEKDKTDEFERNIKFMRQVLNIYDQLISINNWEPIMIFNIEDGIYKFRTKKEILDDVIEIVNKKLLPAENKKSMINSEFLRDIIKNAICRCDAIDTRKDYSELVNSKGLCLGYKCYNNARDFEIIYPDICTSCAFFYLNEYFKDLL